MCSFACSFGYLFLWLFSFLGATSVVAKSVASLVKHRYGRANPTLRENSTAWKRDLDTLRHAELSHLASLVRGVPQRPGKG